MILTYTLSIQLLLSEQRTVIYLTIPHTSGSSLTRVRAPSCALTDFASLLVLPNHQKSGSGKIRQVVQGLISRGTCLTKYLGSPRFLHPDTFFDVYLSTCWTKILRSRVHNPTWGVGTCARRVNKK